MNKGINNYMKKLKDYSLSNFDILALLKNKTNIITYPELHKFNNINEILYPYNCCVILFMTTNNGGHWCCLFKRKDNKNNEVISFYDSYGDLPDDQLAYIKDIFRLESNQYLPHLTALLYKYAKEGGNVEYNEFQHQLLDNHYNTCGRHVCCRLLFKDILNIYQYNKFVNCFKGYTPDDIVTLITYYLSNKLI